MPDALPIEQQPGHAIRRMHQIATALFVQEVAELGITPVQYAALQSVHNQPGIDQRTLSRAIALDASTTGGVLDRLEARGWLERRPSPDDRRARLLFLTAAGAQGLNAAIPAMLRTQDLMLAPLTSRQRSEFMRLLQRLVVQHSEPKA